MIFNPANVFPLSASATSGTAALRTRGWGLAGRHRWHLQFNEEQGLSKHSVLAQFPDRPGTFPSRGREQSLAGTEAGIICLWHLGALYSPSRRVRAGINRKTLELWWGRGWILGWILGREAQGWLREGGFLEGGISPGLGSWRVCVLTSLGSPCTSLCLRRRVQGKGRTEPSLEREARMSQSLEFRQQRGSRAKFAAPNQCFYRPGIPGSHLLAQEGF